MEIALDFPDATISSFFRRGLIIKNKNIYYWSGLYVEGNNGPYLFRLAGYYGYIF